MSGPSASEVYEGLLHFYPRRFRDEYGTDMVALFSNQMRDESTGRVWARSIVDLAITVPALHLEAHMNRPPNPAVPVFFTAISVSGLILAIIGGSNRGMVGFGVAVALLAGVLAVAAWRNTRAVSGARPAIAHWWQVLLGGIAVLATTIVILNVVGETSDGWWAPTMVALLVGVVTTIGGILLGVARLTENRPRRARS